MNILAAVCGIVIVVLGFWSTGRSPTPAQMAVEITCLVGGLVLCFLAVVLSRLSALAERLEQFEPAEEAEPAVPHREELAESPPATVS